MYDYDILNVALPIRILNIKKKHKQDLASIKLAIWKAESYKQVHSSVNLNRSDQYYF